MTNVSGAAEQGRVGATPGTLRSGGVIAVVGYDGTESAQRALDRAIRIVEDEGGRIEAVFVGHVPAAAALSTMGVAELHGAIDDTSEALSNQVYDRASHRNLEWHFQRRDGDVVHELESAYEEIAATARPDDRVVMVVGGPTHKTHHLVGSVASGLVHKDRYEVLVVP
ncbi:MAG TPA: universal stress protein [Acidimicrobiales bacterium]|jgi:nucleotide-binding universal stress UspA family protein|nr:universal stress protein [Acidimicrobiales bacterium]